MHASNCCFQSIHVHVPKSLPTQCSLPRHVEKHSWESAPDYENQYLWSLKKLNLHQLRSSHLCVSYCSGTAFDYRLIKYPKTVKNGRTSRFVPEKGWQLTVRTPMSKNHLLGSAQAVNNARSTQHTTATQSTGLATANFLWHVGNVLKGHQDSTISISSNKNLEMFQLS